MKKLLLSTTFLSVIALVAVSCTTKAQSRFSDIIGKEITNKSLTEYFKGYEYDLGSMFQDDYSLEALHNDKETILVFSKAKSHKDDGTAVFECLDVVAIPTYPQDQYWGIACEMDGVQAPGVIALYKVGKDVDVEKYTDVQKAWKFNVKTAKIEEIPVKGVAVINEAY